MHDIGKALTSGMLPILLLLSLAGSGCTNVDGSTVYSIQGRLTASDSQLPIREGLIVVARSSTFHPDDLLPSDSDWSGFGRPDSDGRFAVEIEGPPWGYSILFGFIPIGSTEPPIPRPPEKLYVFYQRRQGSSWRRLSSDVKSSEQDQVEKGKRWVKLGNIDVPKP